MLRGGEKGGFGNGADTADRRLSEIELHWIVFRQNTVVLATLTNDCGSIKLFDEFWSFKAAVRRSLLKGETVEVKIKLTLKQTWQRHRTLFYRACSIFTVQLDRLKMTWSSRRLTLLVIFFSLASSILFLTSISPFELIELAFALSPLFHKFHDYQDSTGGRLL